MLLKLAAVGIVATLLANSSIAQTVGKNPADVLGSQDLALVKRFTGSSLIGATNIEWDQFSFPTNNKVGTSGAERDKFISPVSIEGTLAHRHYVSPVNKTPLEVHRNYEQALVAAGMVKKYACEKDCDNLLFGIPFGNKTTWTKDFIFAADGTSGKWGAESMASSTDVRVLYGTVNSAGKEVHVLVFTSLAGYEQTRRAYTLVATATPKTMQTGQVVVDLKAIDAGLTNLGKVALYGLFFDSGKADLKPESKAQLIEMAKLLQAQSNLKVFIVGHTDNQGSVDANLQLSQQRAQSVVSALSTTYKIDAKRLAARGVANFSPVATNISEEGRSRNRRVELVVQ